MKRHKSKLGIFSAMAAMGSMFEKPNYMYMLPESADRKAKNQN